MRQGKHGNPTGVDLDSETIAQASVELVKGAVAVSFLLEAETYPDALDAVRNMRIRLDNVGHSLAASLGVKL